ncbi:MAG: hypothetical protein WDN24_08535 [Sphingomonas sp.]
MGMIGKLLDVFEISGRGCVVLVDVESGSRQISDIVRLATMDWPISGIEMPNHRPCVIERMKEDWKPPLGLLLLRGAAKSELRAALGEHCSTPRAPEEQA